MSYSAKSSVMPKTYNIHLASVIAIVVLLDWCQQGRSKQVKICRSKQHGDNFVDKFCRDGCSIDECRSGCICNMTEVVACTKLDIAGDNVLSIKETTSPGTRIFSIPVKHQESWSFSLERSGHVDGSLWRTLQTYFQLKKFGSEYEMLVDKTPDLETIFLNYSVKLEKLKLSMICSRPDIPDETTEIMLRIDPVNEYAPQFVGLPLLKSVPENTAIGKVVFSMGNVTIDRDVNPSSNEISAFSLHKHGTGVSTRMIQLDSLAYFSMPNLQMGLIAVKENLDYEALSALGLTQFVLNVSAVDMHGLRSYTTLRIDVTDINDLPPEFTHPSCPLHIQRTRPCPVSFEATVDLEFTGEIYNMVPNPIHARDMDAIGNNIVLSLGGGPGETDASTNKFSIDNTTGIVVVLSAFTEETDIDLVVVAKEESALERITQAPLKVLVRDQGSANTMKTDPLQQLNESVSLKKSTVTTKLGQFGIVIIAISILAFFVILLTIISMHILCWIKKQTRIANQVSPQSDGDVYDPGTNSSQPSIHPQHLDEEIFHDTVDDSVTNNNILRVENERSNTSRLSSLPECSANYAQRSDNGILGTSRRMPTPEYKTTYETKASSHILKESDIKHNIASPFPNENHYHVTCLSDNSMTSRIVRPPSNTVMYQTLSYQTVQDENGDHYRVIPISNSINHPHTPQYQYLSVPEAKSGSNVSFLSSRRTQSYSHNERLYSPLVVNSETGRRPASDFVYKHSPKTQIYYTPSRNNRNSQAKIVVPKKHKVNSSPIPEYERSADGSTAKANETDGTRVSFQAQTLHFMKEENKNRLIAGNSDILNPSLNTLKFEKKNSSQQSEENDDYQEEYETESGTEVEYEKNDAFSGSQQSLKAEEANTYVVGSNIIDVLSVLPMESGISEDDAFISMKRDGSTACLIQPNDGSWMRQQDNETRFRQGDYNEFSSTRNNEVPMNSTEQVTPYQTTKQNQAAQSTHESSNSNLKINDKLQKIKISDELRQQPSRLPSLEFAKEKILRTIHPDLGRMVLTVQDEHHQNDNSLFKQYNNVHSFENNKLDYQSQNVGNDVATQYDLLRKKKRRRRSVVRNYSEKTSPNDGDGE